MMDAAIRDELAARFLADAAAEYSRSRESHPAFHSAHEGYAVLLEEVDELWELVRLRLPGFDPMERVDLHAKMRAECVQIAAMALAFALEVAAE